LERRATSNCWATSHIAPASSCSSPSINTRIAAIQFLQPGSVMRLEGCALGEHAIDARIEPIVAVAC
jgi:hypothetical protein